MPSVSCNLGGEAWGERCKCRVLRRLEAGCVPSPGGSGGTSEKRHLCSPVAADSEVHGARQLTSVREWERGPGGSQESMSAGAAVSDASVLPDLILLRKIKNPNL